VGSSRGFAFLATLLVSGVLAAAPAAAGANSGRRCRTADFRLSRGPIDSALSHFRQTVKLQNVTHTSCVMSGWFTVQLLDAHGQVLHSQEQRITQD
jgi:hypothetical protein